MLLSDRLLVYRMRAEGEHKIGLRATSMTGRVGYVYQRDNEATLIVRKTFLLIRLENMWTFPGERRRTSAMRYKLATSIAVSGPSVNWNITYPRLVDRPDWITARTSARFGLFAGRPVVSIGPPTTFCLEKNDIRHFRLTFRLTIIPSRNS